MTPCSFPRANSLIITRVHPVAAPLARRAAIGIAAARHLSLAAPAAAASSAPPPPPPSGSSGVAGAKPTTDAAAADATSPPPAPPPPPPPPPPPNGNDRLASASTWLWRTIYLTAGTGAAAFGAAYALGHEPARKAAHSVYEDVESRIRFFAEPSRDKLLPDLSPSFANTPPPRTLVIDLDRTLVHSTYSRAGGWRVAKRPGAEAFLAYLATFYEIVVFTSNLNSYADPILDRLDPNVYIAHRLYRAETHYRNGVHIKDISVLNRDLKRVIVIDHDERCVSLQPENAILVPEWTGDGSDTALLDLIPMLEGLVQDDVDDVRDAVGVLRGKAVAEGVAEYRAMAAERAERRRQASVFGHGGAARDAGGGGGSAATGGSDVGEQEDGDGAAKAKASVWGAVTGRSKLFHTKPIAERSDDS